VNVADPDQLAEWFDASRDRLRAIAYRMLGSLSEVDDALQETWIRASQAGHETIENPDGWLTTILARVCLNMLRSRRSRREEPLETQLPDPLVGPMPADPEAEAILAESIGLALLVVVQTLAPAERLAFVLHDVFGLPFDTIATILGRSPAATRQLASRARRRVRGVSGDPDADLSSQRRVVDAFFAAARNGDLEALMVVLDPDVVLRADLGPTPASRVVRGASEVVRFAKAPSDAVVLPALVNGAVGAVVLRHGHIFSVMGFTVRGGKIVEIDALGDRARLRQLDLTTVTAAPPPSPTGGKGRT
jgi:RNA polymerase sigma-70 factor (ECF subfamily)